MPRMLLLFNHTLTPPQREMAQRQYDITEVYEPPRGVRELWASLPPEAETLDDLLSPVYEWLRDAADEGDFVLLQGDLGACYLLAAHCLSAALVPVYATTRREAEETTLPDGTVRLVHHFNHVRFRRYGE